MFLQRISPLRRLTLLLIFLAVGGCSSNSTHVEVLASVKADAPEAAWGLESSAYAALGKALFGPGEHVVVTPLSDLSETEASIFDESVERDSLIGDNPMQIKERAAKIRAEYGNAHNMLEGYHSRRPRTEIISAVVASASRFRDDPPGTEKVLIILSTGFEQSAVVNMGDASLDLRTATPQLLEALRHRDLVPDLSGVKVCMAGITSGKNGWADTNASLAIKSFWDAYFRAAGARLMDYNPTLSATCLGSVRRADLFSSSSS